MPVANEIHAVIYADNSDQPKAEVSVTKRGVHFAEILLWHAIPLIGRLAAEEQALGELREYSTQLLGDLENVYNGDVSAGHKGEKLQRRLQHNVEYARNMFGQRAQDEGPRRRRALRRAARQADHREAGRAVRKRPCRGRPRRQQRRSKSRSVVVRRLDSCTVQPVTALLPFAGLPRQFLAFYSAP